MFIILDRLRPTLLFDIMYLTTFETFTYNIYYNIITRIYLLVNVKYLICTYIMCGWAWAEFNQLKTVLVRRL